MPSIIDAFYESHSGLVKFLIDQGEVSFSSGAAENLQRSLVLAIASYFEHEITEMVRDLTRRHANSSPYICTFVEKKAIARQYHTYFDWRERRNANSFFSLFGEEFAERAKSRIREDAALDVAVKAFLELGDTRNLLVHLNYLTYSVEKTPDELMDLYHKAELFLAFLRRELIGDAPAVEDAQPAGAPAGSSANAEKD